MSSSSKKKSLIDQLYRAELSYEYLHTNSTTHEFLFGALAELVDNSRDAGAKNLHIYTERKNHIRGDYMICFLDDGEGMSPNEAKDVIKFGHSNKKNVDLDLIGQYGNGLKSGSMRIGNDVMMITKKNGIFTVLFLSREFLSRENIDKIIICLPSFNENNKEPVYKQTENGSDNVEIHEYQMDLILKYSPFKTKQDLFDQFDKIIGKSGTMCVIYNLKLNEDGNTEFDIETDPTDILMSNYGYENDKMLIPEQKSFRAYVSILYFNPRMKIYLQNKKVKTKFLHKTLFKPLRYVYKSKKFKSRSIAEKADAEKKLKQAEASKKEAISRFEHFVKTYNPKSNHETFEYAKLTRLKEEAYASVETEKLNLERKNRAVNDLKGLEFIFGVNVFNRDADGLHIYNSNRLILMSQPTRMQKKPNSDYRGIVGIVNVPYLVLEPTHNKQSFADRHEQQQLISAMSEHMEQYLYECGIDLDKEFWKKFGYLDNSRDLPLEDNSFFRVRCARTKLLAQCNDCLKWRELIFHERYLQPGFVDDDWVCAQNSEPLRNSCRNVEFISVIELREFDHDRKQKQQQREKEKDIERQLKRQQIQQNNLNDFTYDEDDEPSFFKKSQNSLQKSSLTPAAHAKSIYSSFLAPKPAEKNDTSLPPPPNLRNKSQITNEDSINQSSSSNKSQLKRARFVESDSSSDDLDNKKKTKQKNQDQRKSDPTFRPGQTSMSNTSRKSTALKSAHKILQVVNEDADSTSETDTTVGFDYRGVLKNYNNQSKPGNKSMNNASIVKPEPAETSMSSMAISSIADESDVRHSLDSRTIQNISDHDRSLTLITSEKESETNMNILVVNYSEILREMAAEIGDTETENSVKNFTVVSELAQFPVSEFVACVKKSIQLMRKHKVQTERKKFNDSLDCLKMKLIQQLKISDDAASELVDEFRPKKSSKPKELKQDLI